MTRRELARRLSQDITKSGAHYVNGTTVWCTLDGNWGATPGIEPPPPDAQFYEVVGWDQYPERNTVLKIETTLKRIEKKHNGTAKRVDRKSLRRKY